MKKIFGLIISMLLLNGCAESVALLAPASSSLAGKNVTQSAISSALSFGVKMETGKSPTEHAMAYVQEHNPEQKKAKCISFLETTNSETCAAVKKNILETKKKILEKSQIENLASKAKAYNRR
tara:strand:+ start:400 stop:768 length:369 start_codon:yes stop_codon:yes gene_type:complete